MNTDTEKQIPIGLPDFYRDVLNSWHLCGRGKKAPQNAADIRQQIIWGHKFIQNKGKTLYYKHWKDSNINFIDGLLNNEGKFMPSEETLRKLTKTTNWLINYNIILKSIPRFWKETIEDSDKYTKDKEAFKSFMQFNNKYIFDLPTKAKGYYNLLINTIRKRTYNEKYCQEYLLIDLSGRRYI